jgi:hypothetical protein
MKVKSFAAALFAGIGLFAIVKGIGLIHYFGVAPGVQKLLAEGLTPVSAAMVGITVIVPVALFLIGVVLLFRPPLSFLNRYISDSTDVPDVRATSESILRTGFALIGVLLICWAMSPLIELVVRAVTSRAPLTWRFRRAVIIDAIGVGIQVLLGAYLLSGAPDLVRWQMKRIFGKPIHSEQPATEDESADRAPSN